MSRHQPIPPDIAGHQVGLATNLHPVATYEPLNALAHPGALCQTVGLVVVMCSDNTQMNVRSQGKNSYIDN